MTRGRKLFAVGAILAIGLVLAWPFRRADTDIDLAPPVATPPAEILRASNGDPIAALQARTHQAEVSISSAQVHAQTTSASLEKDPETLGCFDIANHPALVQAASVPIAGSVSLPPVEKPPSVIQPAYKTGPKTSNVSLEEWPAELVHVVANGDTLEKLAERYLNDAGRALEIFDLNRDQLSNPHLLPIGVELRVPRNPDRIVD